jgi:hypothetical protein
MAWSPDMLHGRLLAGLAAAAIEREHADPELHFARLTVDLFKAAPMEPVRVSTASVRDGRRIRVVDASVTCGGMEVARASAVMLRRAPHPEGEIWGAPTWDVPSPDELPRLALEGNGGGAIWDLRPITPGWLEHVGQKRLWMREERCLVGGEVLTPFVRVAAAADFTNPFANSGSAGVQFINADITIYLHRLPRDEWIGFEVAAHFASDGVAIGQCTLYDGWGSVGSVTVSALANAGLGRVGPA